MRTSMAVSTNGSGAVEVKVITLASTPTRDDQSTAAEDGDLVGQYLQLGLGSHALAPIVANAKTAKTITVRGDWTNLVSSSSYVKLFARESRYGNKYLYAGKHHYQHQAGFVTLGGTTTYRLPNLYWLHHRHYSPDLGRFIQRDPIGIFTDAPNLGTAVSGEVYCS